MTADDESIYLSISDRKDIKDIGKDCVWSLSSSKMGNGVHQILDDRVRIIHTHMSNTNKSK